MRHKNPKLRRSAALAALCFLLLSCVTRPYIGAPGEDTLAVSPAASPPPSDEPLSFVFVGDTGTGNEYQERVARGMSQRCRSARDCRFALLLGDNIYPSGVKSENDRQFIYKFEEPYKDLDLRFYAVLGNHDHYGNIDGEIRYSHKSAKWVMPARYYRFVAGDAEFFAIDTEDFDPPQAKWLDERLKASKARWKLVLGHHPIYSYGWHGDDESLIADLEPLLVKNGVDFYLCGHEHEQQVLKLKGFHEVISGGGGARLRENHKGALATYARSTHGFAHLELRKDDAILSMLDAGANVLYQETVRR